MLTERSPKIFRKNFWFWCWQWCLGIRLNSNFRFFSFYLDSSLLWLRSGCHNKNPMFFRKTNKKRMMKLKKKILFPIIYLSMQWKCVNVWPNTKPWTCFKCAKLNFLITSSAVFYFFLLTNWFHIGF